MQASWSVINNRMPVRDSSPGKKEVLAAITTVAATYAYFLLFAQFGFLRALQLAANGEQEVIEHVLALMGFAGILGSVFAMRVFTRPRSLGILIAGFMVCAVAAGAIAVGISEKYFHPVAVLIGLGTGVVTVTLAGLLRMTAGADRLGLVIGLGTGAAYAFCNLPAIFTATPSTQAWASLAIAGLGAVAASQMKPRLEKCVVREFDYSRGGIALWTVLFFALVSLDSGAFYIIQNTPGLKEPTWSGEWRLEIIAAIHFAAAVLAGLAFDRRWTGRTVSFGATFLVMACALITFFPRWAEGGAFLYASAVSVYSVALVFYSSESSRPSVAAIVYAVAGWVGSAVGIGLAEHHHALPAWLIGTAGGVIATVLSLRLIFFRRNLLRGAGVAGALVLIGSTAAPKLEAQDRALIAQGRAVFISEGCIHCHSQYVRPASPDEDRWGPAASVSAGLQSSPPLFGNRRQGPDLQNVGNRRSAEWNRVHLISPQAVAAGSRMPSYAYLFKSSTNEGPALLAYLDSLSGHSLVDRVENTREWRPRSDATIVELPQQRRLFAHWCANCHGAAGRGDGIIGTSLVPKPRDLVASSWVHIAVDADPESERLALACLIKFGLPGTAMAGHEYLNDDAILSLAAYLQTMRTGK